MKNILTVLLVVAVLVLAVGVASYAARVDVDYVIGTWHQASLLAVAAVVAALVVVVGVLAAVSAGLVRARERRALEGELERTYVRLRAAEASLQAARPAALVAPATASPEVAAPADQPQPGAGPGDPS